MKPRLSIIIPCYNSVKTLSEALKSCYTQDLKETDFEVILVDDGSSDGTNTLIESLARSHNNIHVCRHTENRGGGAARNTGIKASVGDIIYCLDSDNIFADHSVLPMLRHLEHNKLDGVVFYDRRFFYGSNTKKFHSHINHITNRPIVLSDIFSIADNVLLDNFFFTRAAYLRTAGYPENHGFDTQCFELRFLAAGNHAAVCPRSIFYHRQDRGHNSYFQRVYKAGFFSRNVYLMYEEILHLLSPAVRTIIMQFPIFEKTKLDTNNLKAVLDLYLKAHPDDFFMSNYESLLHPNGRALFLDSISNSQQPEDIFTKAVFAHAKNDTKTALNLLTTLLAQGVDSPVIYFNLLRYTLTLTQKYPARKLEDAVQQLVYTLLPVPQTLSQTTRFLARCKAAIRLFFRTAPL